MCEMMQHGRLSTLTLQGTRTRPQVRPTQVPYRGVYMTLILFLKLMMIYDFETIDY